MDDDLRLLDISIFSDLDRVNRAKLLPEFEEVHIPAGQVIFYEGDPGDALYIIKEGWVSVYRERVKGENPLILAQYGPRDCFGEQSLLSEVYRTATAKSLTPCRLARLSKERFDELLKKHQSLSIALAKLLSQRLAIRSGHDNPPADDAEENHPPHLRHLSAVPDYPLDAGGSIWFELINNKKPLLIVLFTLILGSLLFFWLNSIGMRSSHIALLEIIWASTVFWSFNLFSPHAIALALPLAAVLLKATTPAVAFAGFSNTSWFLILGVSALTAGVFRTGLLYRLALHVVLRFPPNYVGQTLAWAIAGTLLTPVIPSSNGRTSLIAPMVASLTETLRLPNCSNGSTGLTMSCLLGFGHMSFLFMNGAAVCYLILGLLPREVAQSISYGTWFFDAAPMGISFLILSFLSILFLYPHKENLQFKPDIVAAQLKVLGPMTREEKVSFLAISLSLLGFLTQSWHHVDGAWVALASFLILYSCSVLTDKTIRSDIDWGFLITFGSMLGFGNAMKDSGLTEALSHYLQPLLEMFMGNQLTFLLSLVIYIMLLRFILPITPALLVGMLTIMPLCNAMHVSPFVVGLVLLLSSNLWFLPHQNIMYLTMLDETGTGKKLFEHRQTRNLAFLYCIVCLLSVSLSVPYWEMVGLIY
ncbi:anion permease [Heliobacterium chlorum]|uniref:Anion permease n=1 Tax=Heliobacterium chlorum TaxID=2698 RepID=A0ABR7SY29_HELCL|nr:SLC13 family permease [Heliobacterium chlorum]MBC9782940.1 anion permease [Heliobacterium chlorum]